MLKTILKPVVRGSSMQVVAFIPETTVTSAAKSGWKTSGKKQGEKLR